MKTARLLSLLAAATALVALPSVRAGDQPAPSAPPAGNTAPDGPGRWRDGDHGERGERLAKALDLTPDQQAKFKELNQQEHAALEAVHNDATLSKDQKHEKAKGIRKNFETQRRALLTPEQQKKADEFRARMKERREQHRPSEDGGAK